MTKARRIPVEAAPLQEPYFKSADAAIRWAKQRDALYFNAAAETFLGKAVTHVCWTDTSLALVAIDAALCVTCDMQRGLSLAVIHPDEVRHADSCDEELELLFPANHGEPAQRYIWNRTELAQQFIGNHVRRISGGPAMSFLDISNRGTLYVSALTNRVTQTPLLSWDYGD